jgi:hypothetical protein
MLGPLRNREKQGPVAQTAQEFESRMAAIMNASVAAYMHSRFYARFQTYLAGLFGETFDSPEVPPLLLARIDFKVFLEHLDDFRARVLAEALAAMSECNDAAEQASKAADFRHLMGEHVDNFKSKLMTSALQKFLDISDCLREADDQWRAANPEKAALFPSDALGDDLKALIRQHTNNLKLRSACEVQVSERRTGTLLSA